MENQDFKSLDVNELSARVAKEVAEDIVRNPEAVDIIAAMLRDGQKRLPNQRKRLQQIYEGRTTMISSSGLNFK